MKNSILLQQIKNDCKTGNGRLSFSKSSQSSIEVAHLLRHIGIDIDADYSNKNSTGADTEKLLNWLGNNTSLNASELENYDFYKIRNSIKDHQVVFCEGYESPMYRGGHVWIFDGYITINKNGNAIGQYLHCNWG